MSTDAPPELALDIGGTKLCAGLVTREGRVLCKAEEKTPAEDGSTVLECAATLCRTFLGEGPVRLGVASAGQINPLTGTVHFSNGNIRNWNDQPIVPYLSDALGLPVRVENDVNAMALAEHRFGAARGMQHALFLTVGTGTGGALILHGKLWHGASWSGGEVCHGVANVFETREAPDSLPGNLESYTSGPAMERAYADLTGEQRGLRDIAALAREGQSRAREVIETGGRILGRYLAGLACILDPQIIVIGGGVAEIGPIWWNGLEEEIRKSPVPGPSRVALKKAALGTEAVLIGAATLNLLEDEYERP